MDIIVRRFEYGDKYTIGRLFIGCVYQCYTLEDKVREGPKIMHKTAIPAGRYRVIIDHSTRFDKDLPHILDVPEFEGIRIHSGNTDEDTSGCILVGTTWTKGDFIGNSRLAFNQLFPQIKEAIASGEKVFIEVIDKHE